MPHRSTARLAALLFGIALIAAPVLAQPSIAHPDVRRMAEKLEQNAARLGLSSATLAQIRAVVDAAGPEADALQLKLRTAHATMRELLDTPRPDEAAVMQQADIIGGLETELLKQRVRTLLRIRPLLSDEQLAEMQKIRSERMAPVLTHCSDVIANACAGMEGREMVDCLRQQPDLAAPCRNAVDSLRRK